MVIDQLISNNQKKFMVPADPLLNWGASDKNWEHDVVAELIDFMTVTKEKGIYVILSSWAQGDHGPYAGSNLFRRAWERAKRVLRKYGISYWDTENYERYANRNEFWKAWERVLDILQEHGLLNHVLYVDFDQEFPYFSPFADEL